MPKPAKIETMYTFDFREGEEFEIWSYTDKKFNKLISNKAFRKITEKNMGEVKEKLEKYYKCLYFEEDREKFNEMVIVGDLLNVNNYYLYKEESNDPRTFILLLADSNTKMLYYFLEVW